MRDYGETTGVNSSARPEQAVADSPLGAPFDRAGSEKGRWYGRLYDMLIRPVRHSVKRMIDGGLGTMSPTAPSSIESPIGALLDRVGSDKGRWYGRLYDVLLEPVRDSVQCVIEVGIGTMLPTAPSSMRDWAGRNYRPGASLRVWRDYFQSAQIHGIDPATDTVIVGEERITTHQFDSRDAARAAELFERFKLVPDLVIDDGLHTAEAQIATMRNFLPHVRPGGLYIVEDVMPPDVKPVSAAIEQIRPGSIYVPDMRPEPWIAIAIRTPR